MSVTNLADIQRDPARAIRRQLEEMWERFEREAELAAKAVAGEAHRAAYAQRHAPKEPDSAA